MAYLDVLRLSILPRIHDQLSLTPDYKIRDDRRNRDNWRVELSALWATCFPVRVYVLHRCMYSEGKRGLRFQ